MSRNHDVQARDVQAERWLLLGLALFAILVRARIAARNVDRLEVDVDDYLALAANLREDFTYRTLYSPRPTALRPPLYPLLLATVVQQSAESIAAIAALHVALGVGTVLAVARVGHDWGLGKWRLLAAGLVACDPILLQQSTVVMTETLATLLAVLALWALTAAVNRPTLARAAAAGAILGLAVLCRPAFVVWTACAPMAFFGLISRTSQGARAAAVAYLAAAAVIAPWAVRNTVQFGRPIMTTTHGGFTLALANNAEFYEHLRAAPREPWDADEFNARFGPLRIYSGGDEEVEWDRDNYALAWEAIRAEPGMFMRACIYRLSRLWGVLPRTLPEHGPREKQLRYATASWYTLEFALAILGIWVLGQRCVVTPWLFGLLLAASFTVVHAFYWTDMRMRAPLMPAVALAAAAGAGWTCARIRQRKSHLTKGLHDRIST